jgi:hypothetical protein
MYISRGEGCDPINWFNSNTCCVFPKTDLDFQRHMSWYILCSKFIELWWEVIVHFVDIGGIDDHQFKISFHNIMVLARIVSAMYMCVRGIDFAFVSTTFRLKFGIVLTFISLLPNLKIWRDVRSKKHFE